MSVTPRTQPPAAAAVGRAGRNLPVAIAVGLGLGTLITVPLYTDKAVFIGVLAVAVVIASREVSRALAAGGRRVPMVPLAVGGVAMVVLGYRRGAGSLVGALLLTVCVCLVWLVLDHPRPGAADVAATVFAAVYVPFLLGFAALLTAAPDGARRVTTFVATVVCSDVGGYAAGVLVGRHLLAPTVSPKKSWEGLAGSAVATSVAGIVFLTTLLHASALDGLAYGLAVVASATVGDLGESLLKRDIGIKDMGQLLPGHGGLMDRLDSLLITAPVAWLLLSTFAPLR